MHLYSFHINLVPENMPNKSSIEKYKIQFGEPPHPAASNAVIVIISKKNKISPIIPKAIEINPFLLRIDFPQSNNNKHFYLLYLFMI